jgi:enoyl-CoA hydratase/carnithine racemase
VVALQGEVAGGGLELALACDIRICAMDARFSTPEAGQGLLPLAGATQRLPRIAGQGVALAMLLVGESLDADAALKCGLVSAVVRRDDLAGKVDALAVTIASRGPLALQLAKEAVHHGLDLTLDQAIRYESDLAVILQTTRDRAEGVQAFREKREPRFDGS